MYTYHLLSGCNVNLSSGEKEKLIWPCLGLSIQLITYFTGGTVVLYNHDVYHVPLEVKFSLHINPA